MKKLLIGAILLPCLALSNAAHAALPGFTYLEDPAEEGGFDVTAKLANLPVDWSLCEQENGDGYRLKFTPTGIEFGLIKGKTAVPLASYGKAIAPGAIVIQRRGGRWRIIAEKRVLFEADDDTWKEGKIGFRGAANTPKMQPSGDVTLDDDFMRVANDVAMAASAADPRQGIAITSVKIEETVWSNLIGSWSTSGLAENAAAQVAQSANPFVFKAGAKGQNLAIAGKPFWDDYGIEVSVKPEGATAIGVAVYVQDAKNYLLLHWSEAGPVQLRGMIDGKPRIFAEAPVPYDQNQWYRVRLSAANGWVRASIDDTEVLRARTGLFGRGQVGLYTENPSVEASAVFDDVTVRSIDDIADDFHMTVPGRWRTVSGALAPNIQAGYVAPQGAQGAFAVTGEADWDNYTASANIELPAVAAAGVVLHHQAGKGTYLLRVAGSKASSAYAGRAQLVKTVGAKSEVLDEARTGARFDGKNTQWEFSFDHGYLSAKANGVRVLDAFDDSIDSGRPGFFAQGDAKSKTAPKITAFAVEFPHPRPTWATVPELYTVNNQPLTMGAWSTPEGAWMPLTPIGGASVQTVATSTVVTPTFVAPTVVTPTVVTPTVATPVVATPTAVTPDASKNQTMWHKGPFWGDGTVRFKLPKDFGGDQKLNLVFGDPKRHAVTLTLKADASTLKGVLSRGVVGGTMTQIAQGAAALEGKLEGQTVEVARRGRFIIVRAGESNAKLLVAKVAS